MDILKSAVATLSTLTDILKHYNTYHSLNEDDIKYLNSFIDKDIYLWNDIDKNTMCEYNSFMNGLLPKLKENDLLLCGNTIILYTKQNYSFSNPYYPMLPRYTFNGLSFMDVNENTIYFAPDMSAARMVEQLCNLKYKIVEENIASGTITFHRD